MLQGRLVKRIEQTYRLRLVYGLHLALYGTLMVLGVLIVNPAQWHDAALVLLLWAPVLLAHTMAQSLYELRARCATYIPVPVESVRRYPLPVDLYDENGQRIKDKRVDYLPFD